MSNWTHEDQNRFFYQENCDRCHAKLTSRIMSWFTTETLCHECSMKESEIKKSLPNYGRNHEGCGYIPEIPA